MEYFYSITIRPRLEDFDEGWGDILLNNFNKIIIGYERGTSEDIEQINHLQIALILDKDVRTDNLRNKIRKLLNYDNENPVWLVIKKSNDGLYTCGYCLKEGKFKYKGILEEKIADMMKYYEKNVALKNAPIHKLSNKWVCKSINGIHTAILEYIKSNPNAGGDFFDLEKIIQDMFNEDLLPLSLILNLKIKTSKSLLEQYIKNKLKLGLKEQDPIPSTGPSETPKKIFEDEYDYENDPLWDMNLTGI